MLGEAAGKMTGMARSSKNATILLLGSEPVNQSAIREALERAGYLVLSASNLATAVVMLADCAVDLLITHPYIAEIPGHEAVKYLRTKDHGMAVLMVAGVLEDDRLRNMAELERFETFPQPFTAAELVEKVRKVLKTFEEGTGVRQRAET